MKTIVVRRRLWPWRRSPPRRPSPRMSPPPSRRPAVPAEAIALDAGRHPAEILRFHGPAARRPRARSVHRQCLLRGDHGPGGRAARQSSLGWNPREFTQDGTRAAMAAVRAAQPQLFVPHHPGLGLRAARRGLRFRDAPPQLSRHLSGGAAHRIPDGSRRLRARGLPVAEARRQDRGDRPCRQSRRRHARRWCRPLHRIDPATLRADFERAGFVFDGELNLLRNPGDDHSKSVFDPSIRGRTDRVVYRFRRPR